MASHPQNFRRRPVRCRRVPGATAGRLWVSGWFVATLAIACGPTDSALLAEESTTGEPACDELEWSGQLLEVASVAEAETLPPYTRIEGRLVIRDAPGLIDLEFLSCLEQIEGELLIFGLPDLETLAGLERVERVEDDEVNPNPGSDLVISDNPKLATLDALTNLHQTGGITIARNPGLVSLDGIANLEVGGEIWVGENDSLQTIGLRALRTGFVHIGWVDCGADGPVARGNAGLAEIDGLDLFEGYVGEVSGNPNLLDIGGLPNVPHSTAIRLNASLPFDHIVAVDAARDAEFTTCGNLGDPEPCVCSGGRVP